MTINQLIQYAEKHNISKDEPIDVLGYSFEQITKIATSKKGHLILIPLKDEKDLVCRGIKNVQSFESFPIE
jgi:hypothetical protein